MAVYLMPPNYTLTTLEGVRMAPRMLYVFYHTHRIEHQRWAGWGVCAGEARKEEKVEVEEIRSCEFCFVLRRE